MTSVKSKFTGYIVYRIKGNAWCSPRGEGVGQKVEWIDPGLVGELIVRTQALPDININH